jgi:hypothetical protein
MAAPVSLINKLQFLLQAHQHLFFCAPAKHVRISQRYIFNLSPPCYASHADHNTAVSDVFHTGSPDTPLWEFKHGNGNFKRGDLVGLREIKRRASRHALIHRDSFSAPKLPPGPPAGQPVEPMPDPTESRLQNLEHSLYDMHARMQRSEDTCAYLNQRSSVLAEGMMKCHQVSPPSKPDLQQLIYCTVESGPRNPHHADGAGPGKPYP